MQIIPAIDIIEGQGVRLSQGDYARKQIFSDDVLSLAKSLQEQGAKRLHLVDLDGARLGRPVNQNLLEILAGSLSIPVEIGGGIRSRGDIENYLNKGAEVILGTRALEEEDFLKDVLKLYGDRISIGLDCRDGLLYGSGWLENSGIELFDFVKKLEKYGATRIIVTDISKDGMMQGPNIELYQKLLESTPLKIVASGGVHSLDDLKKLKEAGIEEVIIGRLLYEPGFDLKEALVLAD